LRIEGCGLVSATDPEFLAADPDGLEFDSRCYQIFCVAVGLERGPFSFVRINEELLGRTSSGSGLENGD
jgi:hypothetical protein